MITSPFLAGIAKVIAVGTLMAGGAGGIYVVSLTDDGNDAAQVVAETPAASGAESPSPESAAAIDPAPTPTYDPGLAAPGFMRINGLVWLDARPVYADIEAWIGGVLCGTSHSGSPIDSWDEAVFTLLVPSASETPGCGTPEAVIHFRIAGRDANESAIWQDRKWIDMELVAGPPFARYFGRYAGTGLDGTEVEPLIEGKPCGKQIGPFFSGLGLNPRYGYAVVVDPDTLRPGCGRPGATVTFRLVSRDEHGIVETVIADLPPDEPWRTEGLIERALVMVGPQNNAEPQPARVYSEYSMELNIAPTTDAVGGDTFVVQAAVVHDGVTDPALCFNGLVNDIDDDGDTAIDEAHEAGLGEPFAVPPFGCYTGAQWHIDYDESLVDLLPLGSVANTGIARVASAPTLCNQRSDNGRRAYMACANIAPPPNAILAYTGPAFNLTFDCIATGTAVFTLVTTVGETFVSDGASDLPMHVHHDSIECTTEATETPTP